jgi:CxxC motif-containing protein (DUF1111 family)
MNIDTIRRRLLASLAASVILGGGAFAQTDPGPRGGPPASGGPLAGLDATTLLYFQDVKPYFVNRVSVQGAIPGAPATGLGPRFNLDSCAGCHAFPAIGGTSPPNNPALPVATLDGATNAIPPFETPTGPVRVARFVLEPGGAPDGSVHDLFTIAGRTDAAGCALAQPNFVQAIAARNVIFRIPTPIFGDGLIEAVPDANLVAAKAAGASVQAALGVSGTFNLDPVDGTITRFGWKAQQKSLLAFAGEAQLIEEGVTNDLRPNERDTGVDCDLNPTPEDRQPLVPRPNDPSPASAISSTFVNQAGFMRLTAAPVVAPLTAAAITGQGLFASIGCTSCHIRVQTTGPSTAVGERATSFQPYSDFAFHNMGTGLADGVTQGIAEGQDFRSAPLWGLGQRLFFLHDGRTADLPTAISAHASPGSEANQVVAAYQALNVTQKQDVLDFLRSL